ncbi:TetR/AcrR family transcriptional regulator [Paenibacillus bovis]|uniref:TetR/AcrR family transcriptional regulator n=1 Tax=Paenibacillus bovis TaxID=1616788 RepID=UPI000B04088A|nr:TetR/AcrR family transcriptional regulator [Paenibacillus bovis]
MVIIGRTKEFDHTEVLHEATLLFWEKGYEGTSMADLLAAMKISRSSMYETFVDKHHLYLQAIEHYKTIGQEKRDVLIHAESARQGLREYFDKHIQFAFDENSPRGCLITNAIAAIDAPDEQIAQVIQHRFDELGEIFYRLLQKGQQIGEIAPDRDIRNLSYMLLNLNHSINIAAKVGPERKRVEDMMEMVLSMI